MDDMDDSLIISPGPMLPMGWKPDKPAWAPTMQPWHAIPCHAQLCLTSRHAAGNISSDPACVTVILQARMDGVAARRSQCVVRPRNHSLHDEATCNHDMPFCCNSQLTSKQTTRLHSYSTSTHIHTHFLLPSFPSPASTHPCTHLHSPCVAQQPRHAPPGLCGPCGCAAHRC